MKIARQRPLKFQEWYVSSNRTLLTITTCHYHSSRLFPGLCTLKSNWSDKKTKSLIAWGMINFISYLHSIIYFFFALSLPPIFVDFMETLQFIYQRESKSWICSRNFVLRWLFICRLRNILSCKLTLYPSYSTISVVNAAQVAGET